MLVLAVHTLRWFRRALSTCHRLDSQLLEEMEEAFISLSGVCASAPEAGFLLSRLASSLLDGRFVSGEASGGLRAAVRTDWAACVFSVLWTKGAEAD